ncbi:Hsp70 family protein [Phaeobacter sp. HS012]|uniref:Hsp70 family protein n=1 Tax=unclassified Phaeobacter TaxID=2621772 RepID=UPI001B395D6B|nr:MULTISPECIES: Hsp70 family protein [unclassified Phaeobacter]MBQ4806593.1 Hsp70 family protein [Phaeobacter sp. HS012]MBQ4881443.1 Hsp70 family protein [Phaeobacter sp. HS011]
MTHPNTLGIDFGTSNSAAGVAVNGRPWLVEAEPGETTLPTAVFFDLDSRRMTIGRRATRALINGDEGRFMRALKSLLGTPLMHEKRRLNGELVDFVTIVARFLAELKARAEAATSQTFTHALSGRPVLFHSKDTTRNAQAEVDLRACYMAAGFEDVRFMLEPEAALRSARAQSGIGLIVDIGGGTSDFTAFEQTAEDTTRILASHGVRLGGTDFDRQLSIDHVMPLLGRGSAIRNSFGGGNLPAPNRLFNDLATWQMIPFLYAADSRRAAQDLARNAEEPEKLARLVSVLEDELGHDLAFAVERGKIAANQPGERNAVIDLKVLERGLSVPLVAEGLQRSLAGDIAEITACARETLRRADLREEQVSRVVLVGGSALLRGVQQQMQQLCPEAELYTENAMTAVADGLALASGSAFA